MIRSVRPCAVLIAVASLGALGAGCESARSAPVSSLPIAPVAATCSRPLPKSDLVTAWGGVGDGLGVVNATTGRGHMIPGTTAFDPEAVALSHDRCKIAFGSEDLALKNGPEEPGGVFVVNVDGSEVRGIPHMNTGIGVAALSWSPDDRSIAVVNPSGYLLVASVSGKLEGYKLPLRRYYGAGGVGWGGPNTVLMLARPRGNAISDGSNVIVSLGPHGGCSVILTRHDLPGGVIAVRNFAVSNDYRTVVLSIAPPSLRSWRLFDVSLTTHRTTLLSGKEASSAVWAPDDRSVAFLLIPTGPNQRIPIHILHNGQDRTLSPGRSSPELGLAWG